MEKVGGVLITMCVWKKHSSNMEEMRTRKKNGSAVPVISGYIAQPWTIVIGVTYTPTYGCL